MKDHWGEQEAKVEEILRNELKLFFEREVNAGNYITWLAFDGTELLAIGSLLLQQRPGSFRFPQGRSGYIMNMYTKPAYRKKLASKILNLLMESGKLKGVQFFDLYATKSGEPVYVKAGFTKSEEPTYRKFI
jgi:ribosomal protein S18 acetylase RimI-like enzyme